MPRRHLFARRFPFILLDGRGDLIVDELDLQSQASVLRILQILRKEQIPFGCQGFPPGSLIGDNTL
jgi:hypothetical protein